MKPEFKYLAAAVCLAFSTSAQAATITATDPSGTDRATLGCDDCVGFIGIGVTSTTAALTERGTPSRPALEAAYVNTMTGLTTFDEDDASVIDTGGAAALDFTASFQYIVFKIGNQRFLIENFVADSMFDFDQINGTGSGLSHYTGFGAVTPVPLPASSLLLGSALLGGGVALRRRRKRAA